MRCAICKRGAFAIITADRILDPLPDELEDAIIIPVCKECYIKNIGGK